MRTVVGTRFASFAALTAGTAATVATTNLALTVGSGIAFLQAFTRVSTGLAGFTAITACAATTVVAALLSRLTLCLTTGLAICCEILLTRCADVFTAVLLLEAICSTAARICILARLAAHTFTTAVITAAITIAMRTVI